MGKKLMKKLTIMIKTVEAKNNKTIKNNLKNLDRNRKKQNKIMKMTIS